MKEPARLYPKKEKKKIVISPYVYLTIGLIVLGIFSILLAVSCRSPYNMVWY